MVVWGKSLVNFFTSFVENPMLGATQGRCNVLGAFQVPLEPKRR